MPNYWICISKSIQRTFLILISLSHSRLSAQRLACRGLHMIRRESLEFSCAFRFQTVAVRTLYKSLKQKLVSSFSNTPLFQVNIQGLGTKIWILDAKLDNGALSTTSGLRTKIRSPIQQAFEECLSPPDYESFIASFRKQGNNNRDFLKKNLQLGNARVFMMNDLLPLPLNKAHAIILSSCLTVSIEGIGGKVEDRFFLF